MSKCFVYVAGFLISYLHTKVHINRFFAGRYVNDNWLIDWIKVLRPTRHKIGVFGDVLLSQSLGLVLKKLNPTQQMQATQV